MKSWLIAIVFSLAATGTATALPPGGFGGNSNDWCVSCDDCCDSFTFANGADTCEATIDAEGNCESCQTWGNCRIPVAVIGIIHH